MWVFNKYLYEWVLEWINVYPAKFYLFKVSNIETWKRIKKPERCQWCRAAVFIVNFEQILHCSGVSIIEFEHVNGNWETKPSKKVFFTP